MLGLGPGEAVVAAVEPPGGPRRRGLPKLVVQPEDVVGGAEQDGVVCGDVRLPHQLHRRLPLAIGFAGAPDGHVRPSFGGATEPRGHENARAQFDDGGGVYRRRGRGVGYEFGGLSAQQQGCGAKGGGQFHKTLSTTRRGATSAAASCFTKNRMAVSRHRPERIYTAEASAMATLSP